MSKTKHLGVQMDEELLNRFLDLHSHGGASKRIREWIKLYVENPTDDQSIPRPLTISDIKAAVREALAETE